jgi:GTP-binding protein LepA
VVDAAQGIEAQTMANVYLALEQDLAIVAVINKIDLPNADPEKVSAEVGKFIGLLDDEMVYASAKTGIGIDAILEAIVRKMPPPRATPGAPPVPSSSIPTTTPTRASSPTSKVVDGKIGRATTGSA